MDCLVPKIHSMEFKLMSNISLASFNERNTVLLVFDFWVESDVARGYTHSGILELTFQLT